jgi:uncharacterized membrane protein YeaQ/YmgE (transglycosylase-associated protein family)
MTIANLLIFLVIGGLAGWCAGLLTKGSGFGEAGNIIVGIIGAVIGGFCFGLIGISAHGLIGRFIFAVVGALVFTWLLGFIKK